MKKKEKQEEPKKERKVKASGIPILKRPAGMSKILFREISRYMAQDIREEYKRKLGE